MMKLISRNRFPIIGALLGALAGFLYWKFVGCISGTCPIQSNPISSTAYGILMGMFFGGLVKDIARKIKEKRGV